MNLLQETIELAKESSKPAAQICKEAGVKPRWYYRLLQGDFKDPGYTKIVRLHEVLKNTS